MVEAVPVVEVAACLHLQRHAVGELPGVLHVAREEGTPHVLASDEFLEIPMLRWRAVKAAPTAAGSEVHCAVWTDGDFAGFAEEVRGRARSHSAAYFEDGAFNRVQALILGCTHYPLVADQIAEAVPESVKLLDSADAAAHALKVALEPLSEEGETSNTGRRFDRFMVSDLTVSFSLSAQRFFGQPVDLVEHKLPSVTG